MTVTLWIDTDSEETIELGPTIACYQSFAELRHKVPAFTRDFPALYGVLTQCENQEDADPEWLADVRAEARRLLATREDLSEHTTWILGLLAGDDQQPERATDDR